MKAAKKPQKPTEPPEERKRIQGLRLKHHREAVEHFNFAKKPKRNGYVETWALFDALQDVADAFGTGSTERVMVMYRAIALVELAQTVDDHPEMKFTKLLVSKLDEIERAIVKGGPR